MSDTNCQSLTALEPQKTLSQKDAEYRAVDQLSLLLLEVRNGRPLPYIRKDRRMDDVRRVALGRTATGAFTPISAAAQGFVNAVESNDRLAATMSVNELGFRLRCSSETRRAEAQEWCPES